MSQINPVAHLVEALARANEHSREYEETPGAGPRRTAQGVTIALSREAGALGTSVARVVGARLGWPVYDHEILEQLAREMHVDVHVLERMDEKPGSWLQDCMETFSTARVATEPAYFQRLMKIVLSLGLRGDCIIVGRGAVQCLPEASTLRVRLLASRKDRIAAIARERGLSPQDAAHYLESTDRERTRFIKEHFGKDPADPQHYDLVLNTSRFPVDDCAELTIQALRRLPR